MTQSLKLISYNIQAAIGASTARHYVTRAHRQFVHVKAKDATLKKVAKAIDQYDIACLQEVDLGGRRSGFKCQVDQLKEYGDFDDVALQENRIIRRISRHGNAIFSKLKIDSVTDLKLPGKVAGRGALLAHIGGRQPFTVACLHLSLGVEDQMAQLNYLADNLEGERRVIVTGDFNAAAQSAPIHEFTTRLHLRTLSSPLDYTYPSWRPRRAYDHILVSNDIDVDEYTVEDIQLSDHRPVSAIVNI